MQHQLGHKWQKPAIIAAMPAVLGTVFAQFKAIERRYNPLDNTGSALKGERIA